MTENQQNFDMVAGDARTIDPTDNAEEGVLDLDNGGTYDLTGGDLTWVLADRQGGPVVVTKDNRDAGGITITDGPGGVFEVQLDPADTQNLSGEYYHEAEFVDDTDRTPATVWTGWIDIEQDTT